MTATKAIYCRKCKKEIRDLGIDADLNWCPRCGELLWGDRRAGTEGYVPPVLKVFPRFDEEPAEQFPHVAVRKP